ncbi:MAG: DUF2975 domain-containing protein [Candidatus Kryptoniota bacterium]
MRLFGNSATFSRIILSVALGMTLTMLVVRTGLFAYALIKGVPIPSPETFPVDVFMANNHQIVNQSKDIYLVDLSGHLLFFKPPIGLQLYSGFYTIIIWGCLSLIIYLTRKIIQTTVKGNPFVKENGKRLRTIACMFLIVPLILKEWQNYLVSSVVPSIKIDDVTLVASNANEVVIISFAAGIFFLFLSEVFRIGTSVKDENELTV